jgi:hypothetical protein
VKRILSEPIAIEKEDLFLKIQELKQVKNHPKISYKLKLSDDEMPANANNNTEASAIECMIMRECLEKWMVRQQVKGLRSVLLRGDLLNVRGYKKKMNFNVPTLILKRPFELVLDKQKQGQKASAATNNTVNNIDPNVFE